MAKLKRPGSPFDALVQAHHKPDRAAEPEARSTDVQTSEQSTVQTAKSRDTAYKKFTIYIRRETHRGVKARAAEQDRELSDVVEQLLSDWLRKG